MPIYEYQCTACGHQLEAIQKMSDKPLTDCPECHKPALTRLVSAAGFQLKGTGWYKTDYSSKGKPKSGTEKVDGSDSSSKGTDNNSADAKTNDTSSGGSSGSSASSTNTGSAS
jgi:putative FmdB family regulatory protein